jgi:beta-glucosidase-like glycosyl hydrolase
VREPPPERETALGDSRRVGPDDPGDGVARLLLPALRWDARRGWDPSRDAIEQGLRLGVGGFILFGGEASSVRTLTDELRARAPHPLLIASDLERGAGQQFRGATPLPPAAALGALGDDDAIRRAGRLTAREACALGVGWVYAPVADVDLEPDNPIIGTRAFGTDAATVARQVAAWVAGCAEGGALSCAKHFPGHGRTRGDSHVERPVVDAGRDALEQDLAPFRAAVRAGVDSLMTAHVAYPALDADELPATLSPRILDDLLRREIGFDGLVVTDALVMEGLVEDTDEAAAAVRALGAGCDVLLYPDDMERVVRAVAAACRAGVVEPGRVADALRRVARAADRVAAAVPAEWGAPEDRRWALEVAVRSLRALRGEPALPATRVRLVEVEDDLGGPYPPYPRTSLPAALRRAGVELAEDGAPLVAVFSDIRAWKGRPGISAAARERVRETTSDAPDATVLLFSHPRLAAELPTARHLLAAWGGEALMQEAAVAWLTGARGGLASASAGLDR